MTDRELGAAPSECPNCGNALEAVALPDGGVSVSACSKCYPAKPASEKAKRQRPAAREKGTNAKSDEGVKK